MIPACSHTGTPRHFHVSTTSGSASFTSARSRPSRSPRQSPSSAILASMRRDGDALGLLGLLVLVALAAARFVGALALLALRFGALTFRFGAPGLRFVDPLFFMAVESTARRTGRRRRSRRCRRCRARGA